MCWGWAILWMQEELSRRCLLSVGKLSPVQRTGRDSSHRHPSQMSGGTRPGDVGSRIWGTSHGFSFRDPDSVTWQQFKNAQGGETHHRCLSQLC